MQPKPPFMPEFGAPYFNTVCDWKIETIATKPEAYGLWFYAGYESHASLFADDFSMRKLYVFPEPLSRASKLPTVT